MKQMIVPLALSAGLCEAVAGAAPALSDADASESCDRLAAFNDGRAATAPVPFSVLDAEAAISACRAAIAGPEARPRHHLQLARGLLKADRPDEARAALTIATLQEVAAAYFVLGQLYHTGTGVGVDKDRAMALYMRAFTGGYRAAAFGMLALYEDPDSRHYDPETAEATRMMLLVNGLL